MTHQASHINTTDNLIQALKDANVPYELDDDNNVIASEEVVAYLNEKEALKGDTPVVKTEAELTNPKPEDDEVDKGYEFTQYEPGDFDVVESLIDGGDLSIGLSDLKAKSNKHQNVEVYIGPIKELQGKPCLVKRNPAEPRGVSCQFDDRCLVLNGRALGYGWHDFPVEHISDTRPFFDRWKDLPNSVRTTLRKQYNLPRIHPNGDRFMTKKEMRRGVPGAFGSSRTKQQRLLKANQTKTFLLNVICEGEAENKTISVKAKDLESAKRGVTLKHEREFPDDIILNIEVHSNVRS